MKSRIKIESISIIGAGRAGGTIAKVAAARGLVIRAVSSLDLEDAEKLASRIKPAPAVFGAPSGKRDMGILLSADCMFLSVPDHAIKKVAADIASSRPLADPQGRIACHMSGYFGPDILTMLEEAGWSTGCFHPLMALGVGAGEAGELPCPAAISGSEEAAASLAGLARRLGAEPFRIEDPNRVLYHAAASLAANGASVLIAFASELLESAGLGRGEALRGALILVNSAVDAARAAGPIDALTGPASRGDAEVVCGHYSALCGRDKDTASLYRAISRGALRIARERGTLDKNDEELVRKKLNP